MKDLTVIMEDRPGKLAELGEDLGHRPKPMRSGVR